MGKQMQPIRSLETVNRITRTLSLLDDERGRRVFMLWLVGIGMGMRIGDMVDLKVGDLRGQKAYTYTPHKQRHKKGVHPITLPVPATLRIRTSPRLTGAFAPALWICAMTSKIFCLGTSDAVLQGMRTFLPPPVTGIVEVTVLAGAVTSSLA